METHGTASSQFMHESLQEDAVKYDLPTEEIIQALADDNRQFQAENKRLKKIIIEAKICAAVLCIAKLPSLKGLKEITSILNQGIDKGDIIQMLNMQGLKGETK